MNNIPVLIVGAGPTGLMMAYELARLGISFRIIDKKPEITQLSNAVALQTRTLEIFSQMGLAGDFLRAGQPCRVVCFYEHGKEYARARFNDLDSIYQYILALPQAATEKILNDHLERLNHSVERQRELIDVKVNLDDIEVTIQHHDGVNEVIRCQWLIGCDGAHSAVRNHGGFSFPGDELSEQFVVADAVLDSFLPHDEIHIFSDKGFMLGVFPIGSNQHRLGANMNLGYPRKIYTENDIKELVAERSNNQFSAREVAWISPFWIHSRMTGALRKRNIFLAGDAAHIHSPVGGQGMNTGLQDAHNLAWKLALVIRGRADEKLLDTYEQERLPVIKEVVSTTDRFTKFLLIRRPIVLWLRKILFKMMLSFKFVNRYITRRMTQLNINYVETCAMHASGGTHAQDVQLNHEHYFYQNIHDTCHHILVFPAKDDIFKLADFCKQMIHELLGPYKDLIKIHLVTSHTMDEPVDQILDDNAVMHKAYDIKRPTIMVIRPDGYISYRSSDLNIQHLKAFLTGYLVN